MQAFLAKRLATLVATLLGASVVIFLVLEILPGNAAQMMMGPDASPEAVAALAAKLGLDRPPLERYVGLGRRPAHRRARRQPRLRLAGGRADRRAARPHRAAGA